jgi:hypothetical protein
MKMRLYDLQEDYDYQTKKLMRKKPSDASFRRIYQGREFSTWAKNVERVMFASRERLIHKMTNH